MRELVLRVPARAVEEILDRLLLIVPSGVRERPRGRHVELSMRGEDLPSRRALEHAVGRWPHRLSEREVPDDWRERRAADYLPRAIGGRLIVRPDWAPVAPGVPLDVELAETSAFGTGTHPTTRICLERLLELTPRGAFADLGCGSGVLAIVAAKLGWEPVLAVDIQPQSVEAARQNAARNGVEIDVRAMDLAAEGVPDADGFAANVPAALHVAIAAGWRDRVPEVGLLSGFGRSEASAVVDAYRGVGLGERERVDAHDWTVVVVGRM